MLKVELITASCPLQAILAVLLNRPDLEIGPELRSLKDFTSDFPPDMRGAPIELAGHCNDRRHLAQGVDS